MYKSKQHQNKIKNIFGIVKDGVKTEYKGSQFKAAFKSNINGILVDGVKKEYKKEYNKAIDDNSPTK